MIHSFRVSTSKKSELIDITPQVKEIVEKTRVRSGLCIIYVPHTTAGVTLNENADPHVAQDILMGLDKVVPSHDRYLHSEGNSPAHIKASLIGCSRRLPAAVDILANAQISGFTQVNLNPQIVPEPAALTLMFLGLAGVAAMRRRSGRKHP